MREKTKLLLLAVMPLMACLPQPELRITSVRLLQTEEMVAGGVTNSEENVNAVGLMLYTLESNVDLEKAANEYGSTISYSAKTCDSNIKIDGTPYVFASAHKTYYMLMDYKSVRGSLYNLANNPEEICITVHIAGMHPLGSASSKVIRYSLDEELIEDLKKYEQRGGQIRFWKSKQLQQPRTETIKKGQASQSQDHKQTVNKPGQTPISSDTQNHND